MPHGPPRQEEGMKEEEVITDGKETVESERGEEEAVAELGQGGGPPPSLAKKTQTQ
jgi:hypothetical protein